MPAEERKRLAEGIGALGEELGDKLEGALPTLSLRSQAAPTTSVSNDVHADMVFAQQVYGLGRPGDLLGSLTSGRSRNVAAAASAGAKKVAVRAMTGFEGCPLGHLADVWLRVPAKEMRAVQQLHLPLYHTLCEAVEAATC